MLFNKNSKFAILVKIFIILSIAVVFNTFKKFKIDSDKGGLDHLWELCGNFENSANQKGIFTGLGFWDNTISKSQKFLEN